MFRKIQAAWIKRPIMGDCAMWIVRPKPGLIEAVSTPTIWVDGIEAISVVDGVMSIYYHATREPLHSDVPERTLEVILKQPVASVFERFTHGVKVIEYITKQSPGTVPPGWKPHIVR